MPLPSLCLSLCITVVNTQKVFTCAHTHPFLISAHFHYTQSPLLIFANCLLLPLPLVDFRHDVYRDKCYSSFNVANYLSYLYYMSFSILLLTRSLLLRILFVCILTFSLLSSLLFLLSLCPVGRSPLFICHLHYQN